MIELLLSGALAGLLAAIVAQLTGVVLARQVFDFAYAMNWMVPVSGLLVGAACALVGGWIGLRGVVATPPLRSLRDA